jgi:hypothetical protein
MKPVIVSCEQLVNDSDLTVATNELHALTSSPMSAMRVLSDRAAIFWAICAEVEKKSKPGTPALPNPQGRYSFDTVPSLLSCALRQPSPSGQQFCSFAAQSCALR